MLFKWVNLLQYSTVRYLQCYILSFRNCWQQQRTTDRQQLQITIENSTIDKNFSYQIKVNKQDKDDKK